MSCLAAVGAPFLAGSQPGQQVPLQSLSQRPEASKVPCSGNGPPQLPRQPDHASISPIIQV